MRVWLINWHPVIYFHCSFSEFSSCTFSQIVYLCEECYIKLLVVILYVYLYARSRISFQKLWLKFVKLSAHVWWHSLIWLSLAVACLVPPHNLPDSNARIDANCDRTGGGSWRLEILFRASSTRHHWQPYTEVACYPGLITALGTSARCVITDNVSH